MGEEAGAEDVLDGGEEGGVGDAGAYYVEDYVFGHCWWCLGWGVRCCEVVL